MVSYSANVKLMFQLIGKFGSADGIKKLWRATFEGRRLEITRQRTNDEAPLDTSDVLTMCCPLLNQSYYVGQIFKKD